MAINSINVNLQSIAGTYQLNTKSPAKKANTANGTSFKDEVQFSATAQTVGNAVKKLRNMSEVRMDKVQFYTNAIESGNYNVPAANIASKLVSARF